MADFYVKVKIDGGGGGGGSVTSVNGQTGVVVLTKSSIGLANVNNTSDANKPVSTAQQAALDDKLDIISSPVVGPNGNVGSFSYFYQNVQVDPLQNSPNETWNFNQFQVNIDPNSTGFDIGTAGTFGNIFNIGYNHDGTSSIGNASYFNTYSEFGNGTDPITVKGFRSWLGFGNFAAGVTISDSIQGFGMQMNVNASSVMNGYFTGFYDNMNFGCAVGGYISFNANPQIANVKNNNNVSAFNANPTITEFTGNAGFTGFSMAGTFGATSMGATGGVTGVNINPTISNFGASNYYNGIYSSVSNITGAGTNKYAGNFDGDVNITGDLTFGGALSIGQLNAFAAQTIVNGGGDIGTIHGLISSPTIGANQTVALADTIGVNTAALINIGDNSVITTAILGIAALGLPAVVTMGAGSTVDAIAGAVFAVSMDAGATGGTIDKLFLCNALGIPNGTTTANNLYGYHMDLPFGDIGTDQWGLYVKPASCHNFMAGDLKVGGADIADASAAIEIESTTKGFLNARMTTTERNAITAVNGLQIYNSTTDKLQVYAAGSWIDLH